MSQGLHGSRMRDKGEGEARLVTGLAEAALDPPARAARNQRGDRGKQFGKIFGLDENIPTRPAPRRLAVMPCGYERGRGLIIHDLSVREDFEAGFRRFHLHVAEDQLVFFVLQLLDRFGGSCGRIDTVPARFEHGLQCQARRRVIINNQNPRQIKTWFHVLAHWFVRSRPLGAERVEKSCDRQRERSRFPLHSTPNRGILILQIAVLTVQLNLRSSNYVPKILAKMRST